MDRIPSQGAGEGGGRDSLGGLKARRDRSKVVWRAMVWEGWRVARSRVAMAERRMVKMPAMEERSRRLRSWALKICDGERGQRRAGGRGGGERTRKTTHTSKEKGWGGEEEVKGVADE